MTMKKNWFTVKKLKANIWGIAEFEHFEEVISYLIVGSKKALLFDTGMGIKNIREVVTQITKNEISVINSHQHYDHVGGNNLFSNILTKDISSDKRRYIKLDDITFEIILCPGHSPDSRCLYDEKNGYLFAGDTLYPGPIYLHTEDADINSYKNSIQKLASLPKLTRIFPGHNDFKMTLNTIGRINRALEKTQNSNRKKIKIDDETSLLLK